MNFIARVVEPFLSRTLCIRDASALVAIQKQWVLSTAVSVASL